MFTPETRSMLLVEKTSAVALVTLNRPEAMNAMSAGLRAALWQTLQELDADPEVHAIVLTGAGDRAFTAGLDLKELGGNPDGMKAANSQDPAVNPANAVLACRKPVIGAINGVCIAGGFELALGCDVLICSTTARFADTHIRVGITPGWGMSQRLARIIGPMRAKELSLTGNFLDAKTACEWGLVNRVVAPEELLPQARKLAEDMASTQVELLVETKALIDDGLSTTLAAGLALEHERSLAWNSGVTPEMVENRRGAIQQRGRSQ
jgi:enoyl-CoA hydratase